jgi:diguanylate cyclase (GGDEF)-like protein
MPALPLPFHAFAGFAQRRLGSRGRAAFIGLLLVLAVLWPALAQAAPLQLHDDVAVHDGWAVAQVLADPDGRLGLSDVIDRAAAAEPAGPLHANLGRRSGAVWLQIPLQVPADGSGRWVLDIDYASLDRIDVYLLDGPRVERRWQLGDHVDLADRPVPGRSHVVALDLPPGTARVLWLRVETTGSMIVPLWLHTPAHHLQVEAREQALQGLFAGAGLCLLLYSLTQWMSLRDAMFGWYALTLLGTTAFFAALSGVGVQHVWGASTWLTRSGPPFFILLGVCGAFFFVLRALEVAVVSPRVAWVVRVCGVVAGIAALLFLAGAIDYGMAQFIGMALGPAPLLLVLPTAFRRLRAGDRAARWVLVGWGFYSVGVLVLVGVLRGWLPVGFWTMHTFQFASLIEMSMWLAVLAERVQSVHRQAVLMQNEHARLQSLAHTDPLTGLLNRRGLNEAVQTRLSTNPARRGIAVFVLDLDGFKPVNDQHGHEAGDAVLVEVARRLQASLRATDLVCRLGGDEFVVALGNLSDDDQAQVEAERIGRKLLQAFDAPFQAGTRLCRVGVTIGYALSPQDDTGLEGLLKRADAAMYAGKQAGRHCLRRGGAGVVLTAG